MKNFRTIGIAIFVAIILTEAHSVFTYLFPVVAEIDVRDWFIKPIPFFVPLKWWIKFNTDSIFLCTMLFCFSRICRLVNRRLYIVVSIWFFYFVLDYLMFLYHYKLDYPAYYVMLATSIYTIYRLAKPMKEGKGGTIKRMFDE